MDNPLRISVVARSSSGVDDKNTISSPRDEPLLMGEGNGATFETEEALSARNFDAENGSGSTFDVEDAGERVTRAKGRQRSKSGSGSEERKVDHLFASPAFQETCRRMVHNAVFEGMVTTVVLSNTVALAYKGPNRELGSWAANFLDTFDLVCTILYSIEMCVRIVAYGAVDGRSYDDDDEPDDIPLQRKALLRDPWGRLDFFIIAVTWLSYAIQALGLDESTVKISMLRSLRVLRILHSIQYFKSIRAILTSMQYSVSYRTCLSHFLLNFQGCRQLCSR